MNKENANTKEHLPLAKESVGNFPNVTSFNPPFKSVRRNCYLYFTNEGTETR